MIIESDSITATDSTQVEEEDVNLCSDIVAHNSEVDGDGNFFFDKYWWWW